MVSFVVDDLWNTYGIQDDILTANIYCQYQLRDQQSLNVLLSSILRQLAQTIARLPKPLSELFTKYDSRDGRPTTSELQEVLVDIINHSQRSYVVIDALDECDDGIRDELLDALFDMQSRVMGKLCILATARPLAEIVDHFEHAPKLEVRARDEDVALYIQGRFSAMKCKKARTNVDLCAEIQDTIVRCVDGM